ncbi:hypothetical protein GN244_ATG10094 [Phytophthora infestans]|uniref:Uncharacterized protein n=2 Tax=Phytophthora infestans TaxID=4787 RepID=A0A833TAV8_PHYIN|nr:hypothetical protein GN244_ATG10094 [Phytophthora infestans]
MIMSRCESHAIGTRIVQEEAAHLLGDAATASDQFTGFLATVAASCGPQPLRQREDDSCGEKHHQVMSPNPRPHHDLDRCIKRCEVTSRASVAQRDWPAHVADRVQADKG